MKLRLSASSVNLVLALALFPHCASGQTSSRMHLTGAQTNIVTRTSTSGADTITQSDCGKLISYSNPTGVAVALPAASSLWSGCWMDIQNAGSGTVTITTNGSTIDGATSIVLIANQGLRIVDATTQYLTERGQGSSEGGSSGGPSYSADNASLSLNGTTFSANTAILASRVTAAQAVDTTCVTPTGGSPTAYVGAMLGNAYVSGYAEGMRILVEINTTTSGGVVTLDCGSGPKTVYQNDGASNPTAGQWAAGQQVLVSYGGALNSGAGGWRILSGSSSSSSSSSSSGGSPSAVTTTLNLPVGGNFSNGNVVYMWDATNATITANGTAISGISLVHNGSPYTTTLFTWPSNWDSSQPVNVLLTWTGSYGDTNSIGILASMACLSPSQVSFTDTFSYSVPTAITLPNSYYYQHSTIAGVNPNDCGPGETGVLKIARNNGIGNNSADPFVLVGASLQWTSH